MLKCNLNFKIQYYSNYKYLEGTPIFATLVTVFEKELDKSQVEQRLIIGKVHIFWESHKILRNLHRRFDLCRASQIYGGDFVKFCGLLRIYELYL